ncbi:MAG: hypothetical protein ABGY21_08940 [Pseudomonadota bacterium]
MAIDTAAKRASAMGMGCPWLPLVQPDASKPEAWRASAAFAYGVRIAVLDGWTVGFDTRLWTSQIGTRLWTADNSDRLWIAPGN